MYRHLQIYVLKKQANLTMFAVLETLDILKNTQGLNAHNSNLIFTFCKYKRDRK